MKIGFFFFLKTVIAIITSSSPHPCPKPLRVIRSNLIELGIFQKMLLSDHRAIQFTEVVVFFSLSPLIGRICRIRGRALGHKEQWFGGH